MKFTLAALPLALSLFATLAAAQNLPSAEIHKRRSAPVRLDLRGAGADALASERDAQERLDSELARRGLDLADVMFAMDAEKRDLLERSPVLAAALKGAYRYVSKFNTKFTYRGLDGPSLARRGLDLDDLMLAMDAEKRDRDLVERSPVLAAALKGAYRYVSKFNPKFTYRGLDDMGLARRGAVTLDEILDAHLSTRGYDRTDALGLS